MLIEQTPLSRRTKNTLARGGLLTVQDVRALINVGGWRLLLRLPGFGRGAYQEVQLLLWTDA